MGVPPGHPRAARRLIGRHPAEPAPRKSAPNHRVTSGRIAVGSDGPTGRTTTTDQGAERQFSAPRAITKGPPTKIAASQERSIKVNMSSVPIKYLHPEPRYADAAIHGQVVYLAGQVPTDTSADMAGQTLQVLAQIDALLTEAGTNRGRILMAQVIVQDIADVPAMNTVWESWFAGVTAPPRATFEGRLVDPAWKIEVIVTAAL
jgi:enamine deaminase RidA (YjgF/YER057c/UK114 family)